MFELKQLFTICAVPLLEVTTTSESTIALMGTFTLFCLSHGQTLEEPAGMTWTYCTVPIAMWPNLELKTQQKQLLNSRKTRSDLKKFLRSFQNRDHEIQKKPVNLLMACPFDATKLFSSVLSEEKKQSL